MPRYHILIEMPYSCEHGARSLECMEKENGKFDLIAHNRYDIATLEDLDGHDLIQMIKKIISIANIKLTEP